MSTIEVDKIIPQSGTNLQVGEAGDSLTFQNSVIPNSALANGQVTINGVAESEPIKTNVLTGDFVATSFTGTSATLTSLNVNTVTASQTISTNVLTVDTQINSTNLDISATSITIDSNLTVGVIDVNKITGDVTTSGAIKTTNELNVNDLTKINNAGKLTSLGTSDLVLSPAVGRVAKVEGLTSLVIPKGTTLDRPGAAIVEDGAIRYNTDTNQYEGYNSGTTSWSSLGGVRDIDGNTYILAELTAVSYTHLTLPTKRIV